MSVDLWWTFCWPLVDLFHPDKRNGFRCLKCENVFEDYHLLKRHVNNHHPQFQWKCRSCDAVFNDRKVRKHHWDCIHKIEANKERFLMSVRWWNFERLPGLKKIVWGSFAESYHRASFFHPSRKSLKANLWILWQIVFHQTPTQSAFENSWRTESRDLFRVRKNFQLKRKFKNSSPALFEGGKIQMSILPNEIPLQKCFENSFSSRARSRKRIWMLHMWNTVYA